jgi:hypothetical protein
MPNPDRSLLFWIEWGRSALDKSRSNLGLVALVVANLVPLWGILFAGWDAFAIILLYWAENLAVGFYTVLKMACVKMPTPAANLGKLVAIPFFVMHYGGFIGIHGVFVLAFFRHDMDMGHMNWPCFLVFVQILFHVIGQMWSAMPPGMIIPLICLFGSHGVSFVVNFLIKGEYAVITLNAIMAQPYPRMAVMHVALIFGGFGVAALGSPIPVLFVLVWLKTAFDVVLHLREHQKVQTSPRLRVHRAGRD